MDDESRSRARRRLWIAVLAWVAAAPLFALGTERLGEALSGAAFAVAGAVLYFAVPLGLIGWSIVQQHWRACGAVLLAGAAMVFAASPLTTAGRFLNFWSHRSAYDRLVAEAKAGPLPGIRLKSQIEGRRYGVRYLQDLGPSGRLEFPWFAENGIYNGVEYDERLCPLAPPPKDTQAPKDPQTPPTVLYGGYSGDHLSGHYCYFSLIS